MNTWRTYTDLTTQNGRKTDAAIDVVKKMLGKRTVLTWFRKRKKSSFGRKLRTIYTAKVKTSLRTRWVPKINRLIVTNEEKIRQTVEPKMKGDSQKVTVLLTIHVLSFNFLLFAGCCKTRASSLLLYNVFVHFGQRFPSFHSLTTRDRPFRPCTIVTCHIFTLEG